MPNLLLPRRRRRPSTYKDPSAFPSFPKTTLASLSRLADVNGSPAAATNVTSTGSPFASENGIRITVPTTDLLIQPTALLSPIDMSTGGHIEVSFKPIANLSTLSRFVIELFSDATLTTANFIRTSQFATNSDVNLRSTAANASTAGRWQTYSVALGQFSEVAGTGATLSAIRGARLRLRSSAGTAILEGLVIRYVPAPRTKGALIITADDGHLSGYNVLAPKLEAYGWKGVFYPSPISGVVDVDPTRMSTAQLRNLAERGHQIGSQSWSTESDTTINANGGASWLGAEFDSLRAWQLANGLRDGRDGSYFSNVNQQVLTLYPAFVGRFRTVRCFYAGAASGSPFLHGETWPFGDPMAVRAMSAQNGSWGANTGNQLIAHAQQAAANRGVAIIGVHDEMGSPGDANVKAGLDQLLAWADANRSTIDVTTFRQLQIA